MGSSRRLAPVPPLGFAGQAPAGTVLPPSSGSTHVRTTPSPMFRALLSGEQVELEVVL
jgi:hypothetical protein